MHLCICAQEKLDHFGIVALILGTPLTQLMVRAARAAQWDWEGRS